MFRAILFFHIVKCFTTILLSFCTLYNSSLVSCSQARKHNLLKKKIKMSKVNISKKKCTKEVLIKDTKFTFATETGSPFDVVI